MNADTSQQVSLPTNVPIISNVASHSIVARVPLIKTGSWTFADLSWFHTDGEHRIYLILSSLPSSSDLRPSYHIGIEVKDQGFFRLLLASPMDLIESTSVERTEILLVDGPRLRLEGTSMPRIPLNASLLSPFKFPQANIEQFLRLLSGENLDARLTGVENVGVPWSANSPAIFRFSFLNLVPEQELLIQVGNGSCSSEQPAGELDRLWASAQLVLPGATPPPDQLNTVATESGMFHAPIRFTCLRTVVMNLLLSFTPAPMTMGRTQVLSVSFTLQ